MQKLMSFQVKTDMVFDFRAKMSLFYFVFRACQISDNEPLFSQVDNINTFKQLDVKLNLRSFTFICVYYIKIAIGTLVCHNCS